MNRYKPEVGRRTRFLNIFRQIFRIRPFEHFAPPNYLYPKNSERCVQRSGIKYRLDIGDFIEYWTYFGAPAQLTKNFFGWQ